MRFNTRALAFLLAFPVALMATVQITFSCLSYFVFKDHEETLFLYYDLSLLCLSVVLIYFSRGFDYRRIGYKESLLFATLTWVVMGLLGAIPIIRVTHVSLVDGIFESVSAISTTGATILTGLDEMPKTFLLYRQFLQWLGGLGVVIFVVAVLPMLNIGGMRLLKAEMPGPIKDSKLAPSIAKTAHYLWAVYVLLTLFCIVGYRLGGMSTFDAIAHSFTTVSTGGFSTHDASLGYFNSNYILMISNFFMLAGSISFALHFGVFRSYNPLKYWRDEELRVYIKLVLLLSLLITMSLMAKGVYDDPWTAMNYATFHLISFISSTGFTADNLTQWPLFIIFILYFAGYVGGCAGSTAGGNKIIRDILTIKMIRLHVRRLIHPSGVFVLKYQGRVVAESTYHSATAFMTFAVFASFLLTLLLMFTGLDFWTSLTAVAACLNVLGPAFGELGTNFQPVNDFGTCVLSFAMILGRLEYFTVLALLFPGFWKS
jgi:trk system potassium uptake protein TrkH